MIMKIISVYLYIFCIDWSQTNNKHKSQCINQCGLDRNKQTLFGFDLDRTNVVSLDRNEELNVGDGSSLFELFRSRFFTQNTENVQ